jgi:hypothetical protein
MAKLSALSLHFNPEDFCKVVDVGLKDVVGQFGHDLTGGMVVAEVRARAITHPDTYTEPDTYEFVVDLIAKPEPEEED